MTDAEWKAGYGRLLVALGRDLTPQHAAAMGRVYRETLDDLNPEAWVYAAREAIRRSKYFPTVAELLDYADDYRFKGAALPASTARTPEQRESDRETARRGVELIRARLGATAPPLRDWPAPKGQDADGGNGAGA